MSLDDLQRIKMWHVAHRHTHPVEYHAWDMILMLWVVGWVGWLPAYALDAAWSLPLLMLGMAAPTLYVALRVKAHRARKLRCDWSYAAVPAQR